MRIYGRATSAGMSQDELGLQPDLLGARSSVVDKIIQPRDRDASQLVHRLAYGGEFTGKEPVRLNTVEAKDAKIIRHGDTEFTRGPHDAIGHGIAGRENRIGAIITGKKLQCGVIGATLGK